MFVDYRNWEIVLLSNWEIYRKVILKRLCLLKLKLSELSSKVVLFKKKLDLIYSSSLTTFSIFDNRFDNDTRFISVWITKLNEMKLLVPSQWKYFLSIRVSAVKEMSIWNVIYSFHIRISLSIFSFLQIESIINFLIFWNFIFRNR